MHVMEGNMFYRCNASTYLCTAEEFCTEECGLTRVITAWQWDHNHKGWSTVILLSEDYTMNADFHEQILLTGKKKVSPE